MGLKDYARICLGEREIRTVWRGDTLLFSDAPTAPGSIPETVWGVVTGAQPGEVILILSALPASGGSPVTGFLYRIGTGVAVAVDSTLGDRVLSGLEPGAATEVRIAAVNAVGQGPWSATKTVTVKAEPIAPPSALAAPVITGTPTTGETLTVTEGSWTGAPTVALQWLRGTAAIPEATGPSHVLATDDVGAMISVLATATNAGGIATAASAAVGPVAAAASYEFETDIVILAYGESNEQSQNNSGGQPIDAVTDQDSSGRIRRWDATTGTDVQAVQPLTGWPAYTQMRPLRTFRMAQDLLARQDPARKIVIVNCAVGGAKLTGGTLRVGGTYYTTMISRMTACLAAFPEAQVFLSWTQGEQDANDSVTAANYTTAFTAMVNGIRAIPGASGMQAIIHQMVPERFYGEIEDLPYRRVIDRAHKMLPLTVPEAIFVGASLGTQIPGDPSHFTAQGHRNAGTRAAAWVPRIGQWQMTVPDTPAAPAIVSDATIRITVSDPQPPAYVIEYRPVGSNSAWIEQIVFPNLWIDAPGTFDVTVEGTGNREVRLKARSYAGTSAASTSVVVAEPMAGGLAASFGENTITVTGFDTVTAPSVTFGAAQIILNN